MSDPSKAQQRAEAERLTADYDGPVTRRKRDQRISMVCPQSRARRIGIAPDVHDCLSALRFDHEAVVGATVVIRRNRVIDIVSEIRQLAGL